MKILIISHNVFSDTGNMGKTLVSYFKGFESDDLAQFYIHSEIPTLEMCKKYYRVTDKEMIMSIFGKKNGKIFAEKDIEKNRQTPGTATGLEEKLCQKARKRTPLICIMRNLWWKLGHWNNRQFKTWLNEVNPDCLFFASGDYAFMYDIALKIAKSRNIPMYVSCVDDYYFNNRNRDKLLGKFQHHLFMKQVKKCISYSSGLFCICDAMTRDYAENFGKKCVTIHTAASFENLYNGEGNQISYIGNLGYRRDRQLVDIGRALKKMNLRIDHVDVYSMETNAEILKHLTPENGIVCHGGVSADEVKTIMSRSLALIHTEAFDESTRNLVKYSVSTKIADSLMSGACLFAYGPEEIASIKYLSENEAALCVTAPEELEKGLKELLENKMLREQIRKNATALAEKNHGAECTYRVLTESLNTERLPADLDHGAYVPG